MKPWSNPVIWQEAQALMALPHELEGPFQAAVSAIINYRGKVVCTGVGKSGHVARKIAATMTSTGTPAFFLHPTEAAHGDLGLISSLDVVLVFSRSGRAVELVPVMEYAKKLGITIILVSENDSDSLAKYAYRVLKMPKIQEAWGHAPTTSTIMQMAIGDAIAVELARRKGFTTDDFVEIHPGGELGKKSFKVSK